MADEEEEQKKEAREDIFYGLTSAGAGMDTRPPEEHPIERVAKHATGEREAEKRKEE